MKKRILFLILGLCYGTFPSVAQNLSYGFKFGGGGSHYRDFPSGYPTKFGKSLAGGIFINYKLNNFFSLQPELLYSQKGNSVPLLTSQGNNTGDVIREELTYCELPVLIKVSIGNKISPYLLAGISPGYNFSGRVKAKSLDINEPMHNFYKIDLSLLGSLGLEMKLGKINPFVEIRYGYGLLPIYKGTLVNNKNTVLLFSGGIRFK